MRFPSRQTGVSTFLLALLGATSLYGQDPVALINQPLVPTTTLPGTVNFSLTINGTGFTANSIVHWNGNARTTTFVNTSQLTADIPDTDVATATTAEVAVDNPAPGGSGSTRSNIVFFQVTDPTASVSMSNTEYAAGVSPSSVTAGDFNGDSNLDLAVANANSNTVSILLGVGDGTLSAQTTFATGAFPTAVTAGDFNADGNLDLAVANELSNTVSILLGNGNGTFQPQTTYATGIQPTHVTAGDFNGDGKLDLAVANFSSNTVSILLGNGNGTFQTQTTYATGIQPTKVTAGDFNGDGKLDLAVANNNPSTVSILLGNGNGTFQTQTTFATGLHPQSVMAGDFNGDGKLDLAAANFTDNTVSILLGNGNGTFQTQTPFATGGSPNSVTAGDFNGDGELDLAVANSNSNSVSILLGNGDGTFQTQIPFPTGAGPNSVTIGDFNGDGELDLAVTNGTDNTVSVLLQTAATGPVVQLSTPSLAFGNQLINTSGVLPVTITNTGTATLTLSSIGFSGTDAASFALDVATTTCTNTSVLAVNAVCDIGVTFSPTAGQSYSASLDIGSDATNAPTNISLTGAGVLGIPNISVAPTDLDFGAVLVGSGMTSTTTVTNTGTGDLTLSGITIGGTNASDFFVNSDGTSCVLVTPIVPDAACDIEVAFIAPSPASATPRVATLTITSDDPDTPSVVVNLTARSADFSFDVQSGGSTSATVAAGGTAVFNLQIEGTPGVTGNAALACVENITEATCSVNPTTVVLSESDPAEFVVSLATTVRSTTTARMPMVPPNSNPRGPQMLPLPWVWALAFAMMLGTLATSRRRARLVLLASMLFVLLWSACGKEPVTVQHGTPAGVYTITVNATAGVITKSQTLTVTVN